MSLPSVVAAFAGLAMALGPSARAAALHAEPLAVFPIARDSMPAREALSAPAPARSFRAPDRAALTALSMGPNLKKADGKPLRPGGPLRVATVREAATDRPALEWHAVAGGHVARLRADAVGAYGLRVRLDFGAINGPVEIRAAGEDGRVFTMFAAARPGESAWTPWTDGAAQVLEIFTAARPPQDALTAGALLHFDVPAGAKAASSCTVSSLCTTGDAALDAAIAEARKSILRISGVEGGSGFFCSATLVNTPKFPAAYVLTAHHCVGSSAVASTLTSRFFYETTACDSVGTGPNFEQVAGGMQLVFTNFHVDASLLLMNAAPPTGAVYAGISAARMVAGDSVVSLSHPKGDAARLALGSVLGEIRPGTADTGAYPQDMYQIQWTRGATEGGSSGSGLFTRSGGSLQLRGILFGGPIGDTCDPKRTGIYSRLEIFHPQFDPYIRLGGPPADDAPNRAIDFDAIAIDSAGPEVLDLRTTPLVYANRSIGTAGDVDVYRFILTQPRTVAAWTEGGVDLVGSLLSRNGDGLRANDDAQTSSWDFGLTRELQPGTYFIQIAHFDALGTGNYTLKLQAWDVATNYTDLWWNAAESGWGLNINHQGNVLFATLFTYDLDGTPMWLVLANAPRQPDGTYQGDLYRTTGPAFFSPSWSPINTTAVGTMRLAFGLPNEGTLTYTVNGVPVVKSITRQRYATAPTCTWSAFDRSFTSNWQDLWWNPSEPGWGINLTHQGTTVFATLFAYGPTGKGTWYVMSNGDRTTPGVHTGKLYRTTGPAFNASPWTAMTPTEVGTMTVDVSGASGEFDGSRGTLRYTIDGVSVTKSIERQVFGQPRTECSP